MRSAFVRPLFRMLALPAAIVCAQIAPSSAETYQPSAMQPVLPSDAGMKSTSPVVDSLMGRDKPVLEVRKAPRHVQHWRGRRYAVVTRRHRPLDRPALAGVELLQPLPRPGQPPHIVVPTPGYPLDNLITAVTMPAPPIVCHPVRQEPGLPDPHLYRERTVVCEADNP